MSSYMGQEVKPCFLFLARILFCLEPQKGLRLPAALDKMIREEKDLVR